MKKALFLYSVIAIGMAKPNGYFHQEYSYKSSSSSFKNNELQHKKDDQGFYSKDGDLEGRVKPKVKSQSEHSEYTNPKLLDGSAGYQTTGFNGGNSANYLASSDRLFGGMNAGAVDGYASSDRVLDLSHAYNSRGYGSGLGSGSFYGAGGSNYGYTQGGSSYGYVQRGSQATSGSYGTNANLNSLMQRLQDDMTRQMEYAINNQYQSSGYSSAQMNTDIRLLEEELRRNLTRQLQDSLRSQYGSGTHTIVEGRPVVTPTYSTQELASLTRRLEDDLISKLRQTARTTYNRESSSSYVSSQTYRPVYPSSTLRPYYDRPVITTPTDIRYTSAPSVVTYPVNLIVDTPRNIRYTPVSNPESLTQIVSRTQSEVNSHLDTALENLYSTYLQTERSSYYTIADFDNAVNRIRDEIIRNLTYNLDDQIRRNYGQQILKNDYYYTIGSNGEISTQHNYNSRDLESLKKQVEENLLRKLNQTVNSYRDQYQRRQTQYSASSSYAVTYRPTYYTSGSQLYDYSDLQRQLSNQLQNALNKHGYSQSYSATSYNPQAYQTSLDELTRELQRNLTQQLSSYRASSGSSSSYGYSSRGGSADFESMKNQLQNQLMQQLRQGLQNKYQYSASASYSASSSSSANAGYGMQSYGGYPSNCMHGCGRKRRDIHDYTYSSKSKRHGVKSVRRSFSKQATSDDESSLRYLHHPEDLSYPQAQIQRQSSYSTHFTQSSSQKTTRRQEIEPDIVEDLGIINNFSTTKSNTDQSEDDLQKLEKIPRGHILRYAKQSELPQQALEETQPLQKINVDLQQLEEIPNRHSIRYAKHSEQSQQVLEEAQPLQKIKDDLSQQLEIGHRTSQNILKLSGKLEDHSTQQLEVEEPFHHQSPKQERNYLSHSHKLDQNEQELEGQLTLGDQTLGQHLEDHIPVRHLDQLGQHLESQRTTWHSHRSNHHNQAQQAVGQQLEDQNVVGHLNSPWRSSQNSQVQINLDQQTLGQQLDDHAFVGQGQKVQKIQDQLSLGQKRVGQNLIGEFNIPKQYGQRVQSQLNLDQLPLGQQLEDQNLVGQLSLSGTHGKVGVDSAKPKHLENELVEQLTQTQQELGQQLEDQNLVGDLRAPKIFQKQPEGDDQNQQDLTQQLETEPKAFQVQQSEIPTQQLEIAGIRKPKDQQYQEQSNFDFSKYKKHDYEQQQSNSQILEQSPEQHLTDAYQQLELTRPFNKRVKVEDDDTQKLEKSTTQQVQTFNGPDQKFQNQENLDSQLVLQSVDQQLEGFQKPKHPRTDITQQIADESVLVLGTNSKVQQKIQLQLPTDQKLEGTDQKLEETDQKLVETDQKLEEPGQKLEEIDLTTESNQRLVDLGQKLEDSAQKLEEFGQKLEEPDQKPEETYLKLEPNQRLEKHEQELETSAQKLEELGQKLEEPSQKLEELGQKLEEPDQNIEELGQKLEEPDQKLELGSLDQQIQQKHKKHYPNQEGQLEEDSTTLELVTKGSPKTVYQNLPTLESELSFSPETTEKPVGQHRLETSSYHPYNHYDRSYEHHSDHNSDISQGQYHSIKTFGGYGQLNSNQRPFTNGHSGQISTDAIGFRPHVDTYENALNLQNTLMDLLKKKVEDINTNSQEVYGKRTIKKTVFINGKAVENEEHSQLIKPNGEVVEIKGGLPSINAHTGQLNSYSPTHSSIDFSISHNPSMYSSQKNWLSEVKSQETNPFSYLDTSLNRKHLEGSEISGKTTRRVVHYVNGKPISASEKIQILKPNGEVIERNYDLPTSEMKTFTHKNFGNEFIGTDTSKTYSSSQDSSFSRHQVQGTSHYVNGKLVEFSSSSQDLRPNSEVAGLRDNHPLSEHLSPSYTSGIKTTRHYGISGY